MLTFPEWLGSMLLIVELPAVAWVAGGEIAEHRAKSKRYLGRRDREILSSALRMHSR